ncbi:asparaginase [Streptomyces sp. FXJ1.4098]|nr:asparaginase [Streptomyces sp. FXJ1.4098]
MAALPDGRALAVKIADGGDRARMPVTAAALAHLGVDPGLLTEFAEAPSSAAACPSVACARRFSSHRHRPDPATPHTQNPHPASPRDTAHR